MQGNNRAPPLPGGTDTADQSVQDYWHAYRQAQAFSQITPYPPPPFASLQGNHGSIEVLQRENQELRASLDASREEVEKEVKELKKQMKTLATDLKAIKASVDTKRERFEASDDENAAIDVKVIFFSLHNAISCCSCSEFVHVLNTILPQSSTRQKNRVMVHLFTLFVIV